MKERSKKALCNKCNANGKALDLMVIEKIKQLTGEKSDFIKQLEKSKIFYTDNCKQYEQKLSTMKKEKADLEKKVSLLIDTLVELGDNSAKKSIIVRINKINTEIDKISQSIVEMIKLTAEQAFSDIEFDALCQVLGIFQNTIGDMSCEQKRISIQSIVRRVIWDGENAHVILYGSQDDDIGVTDIRP